MLMNEIFKTKFVSLLSDTSVVANEEMQNAYVDFVVQVGTSVSPNRIMKNPFGD